MKTRRYDTRWIALMALFIAIQLFLNLSGIGLIPLPVIKGDRKSVRREKLYHYL